MATNARTAAPSQPSTNDNLRIWNELGVTDPSHTKGFSRGGGFKGTAVKPMWQNKRLTEMFGPCGIGWGFDKPEFQIVPGNGVELLVFCTVAAWYVPDPDKPDDVARVYGVGGDKVIAQFSAKVANDDEAFKKSFTDAIGNAFKFIGVAADVHMGLFDDSKYVQEAEAHYQKKADELGPLMDKAVDALRDAKTLDDVTKVRQDHRLDWLITQLTADDRAAEAQQLHSTYKARRAAVTPKPQAVQEPESNDATAESVAQ